MMNPSPKFWTWFWPAAMAFLFACGAGTPTGSPRDPVPRPERAELRAYHGAPPVIPHEVASLGRGNCISCHGPGQVVGERAVAPVTPHPLWTQCTQCHVEQTTDRVFVANGWAGLAEPDPLAMASPFLPPYIPHRLDNFREESCETCHIGPQAPPAQRPNHGPRTNCTQCHVPRNGAMDGFLGAIQGFPPEMGEE